MSMNKAVRKVRRAAGILGPPPLAGIRDSLRYGRDHRLSSPRSQWVLGYRDVLEFGLHLIPPGTQLDGLVVDAGANRGDFTATVRKLEPRSRILAIEPIPGEYDHLTRRFADDPQVTVDRHALSDQIGTATLHVTSYTVHTSLLAARNDTMTLYDGGTNVVDTVTVPTARLDDLVKDPVRLLKLDVQGYEMPVLQAARTTLTRTEVVLLEVMFQSHYEGDSSFFQLDDFMRDAGFVLAGLSSPNQQQGVVLWADACYRRQTSAPR